jgi:hypothetical protein
MAREDAWAKVGLRKAEVRLSLVMAFPTRDDPRR